MVSVLDSGASAPGSSPRQGHCVVFLGKTLYSHRASLHYGKPIVAIFNNLIYIQFSIYIYVTFFYLFNLIFIFMQYF